VTQRLKGLASMMKMTKNILIVGAITLCLLSSDVYGQVRRGVLDANPRVGSGGVNQRNSTRRINSQLYVTGQVSGLARFRGSVPYTPGNELSLQLPSASLSRFIQESIGLKEVRGGNNFTTSEYFDRARTVPSQRDIALGRTLKGTSIARGTVSAAPLRSQLQADVTRSYAHILETGITRTEVQWTSFQPGKSGISTDFNTTRRNVPARSGPAAGTLFGLARAEDRFRLARQIADLSTEKTNENTQTPPAREMLTDPTRSPDIRVDPNSEIDRPGQPLPAPDEDVFIDVLRSLKNRRKPTASPSAIDNDNNDARNMPAHGEKVGYSKKSGLLVSSLAGKGADRFNQRMRTGEFQMRSGRYYSAAAAFKAAGLYDRSNPLANIGAGFALFAAGESVSASREIQFAIKTFPTLTETRFEATEMIPVADLSNRLKQLKSRLDKSNPDAPNLDLLFLSTFMYQNTGQFAKARADAVKLHKAAKANKFFSSYAENILQTRKVIRESKPKTAPATE